MHNSNYTTSGERQEAMLLDRLAICLDSVRIDYNSAVALRVLREAVQTAEKMAFNLNAGDEA